MKKLIVLLVALLSFGLAWGQSYIQLSSSITQRPEAGEHHVIVMNQVDAVQGILVFDGTDIVVTEDAAFLLFLAPQVGSLTPGGEQVFTCWIEVNGQQVENSNVLLELSNQTRDVIVAQAIVPLQAGDVVNAMMSVSREGVGIEAIDVDGQPLVPSIIFSMTSLHAGD